MQSTSSRTSSPARKNKTQSQREYRSKEVDGFSELRDALLLVDPFDTPLGRDATRHQLLITAAKKLRNLADENEKLVFRLSAMPTPELEARVPPGLTAQSAAANGVAWSTQPGYGTEHLSSTRDSPSTQTYEDTFFGWAPGPSFNGNGHQPYDMALGSSYHVSRVPDTRRFC